MGPSKRVKSQLFLSESGSDNEEVQVVAKMVEVRTQADSSSWELVEALQAQMAMVQLQVNTQEWLGQQMEQLSVLMDLQQDV